MARVWYGLLLANGDRHQEAEQVLREAVDAAPQDDRPWNGLFTFYVQTGDLDKARTTLGQMISQAQMAPDRRAIVLGQAYEALNDDENAETIYREAVEQSPRDAEARVRLTRFYVSRSLEGKPGFREKAIDVLGEIVQSGLDDGRAKRTLATLLAGEGGDQWRSALDMLGDDTAGGESAAVDRRLRATLLFRRDGDENLAQALQIFQELADSAEGEPGDRLFLARILERQGDIPAARAQFSRIVPLTPPNTRVLSFYVDFLLRHDELDEAQRWLQVLEAAPADEFSLVAIELRARLLVAQGRAADEVAALIDPLVTRQLDAVPARETARRLSLMAGAGDMYTRVGLHAIAEPWYRRVVESDRTQIGPLAGCLARQGRADQAIDLCLGAPVTDSAVVARVLAGVLVTGTPSPADHERADPILLAAEQEHADNPTLLMELSNVRIVQDRLDDAVRLLEKTVTLDPRNVLALNNLAMIMSEQPDRRTKALEYIDRALDITGPRPDLCDTKASILIYQNRPAEAIPLLEFAIRTNRNDPRFAFHLAAAHFQLNDLEKATRYFRESIAADLESQILTETDRQLISEMRTLLDQ